MMNLKRNEKGITLIALIITIVVLLILAIVAIGQAQESNIVGYAQNAASKYTEAEANEVSLLSTYEVQLEAMTAAKIVLKSTNGMLVTLLPETGNATVNVEGKTYTGTFEEIEVTDELISEEASNGMSTNKDDYTIALRVNIPSVGRSDIILIVPVDAYNVDFYGNGEKLDIVQNTISMD